MTCQACGAGSDSRALFCWSCGGSLSASPQSTDDWRTDEWRHDTVVDLTKPVRRQTPVQTAQSSWDGRSSVPPELPVGRPLDVTVQAAPSASAPSGHVETARLLSRLGARLIDGLINSVLITAGWGAVAGVTAVMPVSTPTWVALTLTSAAFAFFPAVTLYNHVYRVGRTGQS